jgi:hypothetical protein
MCAITQRHTDMGYGHLHNQECNSIMYKKYVWPILFVVRPYETSNEIYNISILLKEIEH